MIRRMNPATTSQSVPSVRRPAAGGLRRRAWTACAAACLALSAPAAPALAQDADTKHDARLEGYPQDAKVALDDSSTALTWLLFIFIAVCGVSPLFMGAKRTHLD